MKKVTIILTGVILMSIASLSVKAQSSATAAGVDASATIVSPIAILKNIDLEFGRIITDADGGTVVLQPAENAAPTYPDLPTQISTGDVTAAKFTITGDPAATYKITMPATISLLGTGDPMLITTTQSKLATGNVLVAGPNLLYVGGTLAVGASQAAGAYSAKFDVTVAYE